MLLRPWDFPGKSAGVGCRCLLHLLIDLLSKSRATSRYYPLLQAWKSHCIVTGCHNLQVTHFFFFLQSFQVLVGNCFAHIWGNVLYWEYHSWTWKWVPAICRGIVNYLNQGLDSSVYPAPVYFLFLVFPLNRKNRQVRPHLPPPPCPSFSLSYN